MSDDRTCAVCGKDISDLRPSAVTCGQNCRTTLHRRNKAAKIHEVDAAAKNAVAAVVQEQVREYVSREVLTEGLLERIQDMVGLTPTAILALERMLDSEDDEVSIRAAQTILKYTLGNPSVAPAPAERAASPVTIQFGVPRPGDEVDESIDADAVETRMCADCHHVKPVNQFVAGSPRCQTCFDTLQEQVHARLAPADPRKRDDDDS